MNTASRFQRIITKCMRSFSDSKVRKQIGFYEKELQQAKKDHATLVRYINDRRKKKEDQRKEEAHKKAKEEARKKTEEGQSFKDVRTWRK
jgi:hypothetical protein